MKNSKEVMPILTALYVLNCTADNSDSAAEQILKYAFCRLFGSNTNLLLLACLGQTREGMLAQVEDLLKAETNFCGFEKEN